MTDILFNAFIGLCYITGLFLMCLIPWLVFNYFPIIFFIIVGFIICCIMGYTITEG